MEIEKAFRLVTLAILALTGTIHAEDKKPNIIFLFADDQNTLSVGCYGNDEVKTPNMDKLGAEGIIFDKHYNTTAICMASRANVMTGMYEYKTGTNFEHGNMTKEIWTKSYPVLIREAGYLTAFAGKFGFEIDGYRDDASEFFDKWGGGKGQTEYETAKNASMKNYAERYPHSTLSYGAFSQDFIKESVAKDTPFCLSISFKAPHRPDTPDPKFDHIYEGAKFTKPSNWGREHGEHMSQQSKQGRQYERFTNWTTNGQNYDTDYDKVMTRYHQQVYAVDVALGMIREELETQGIADNTVIIYTRDNGFICGSHGYASKVLPLEESARVPLMIYDPRSTSAGQGKRSSAITGNIDFAPTMLELAGVPVPENMDGISLLPVIEKPEAKVRDNIALLNAFGPAPTQSLTMVTEDWKYTYWWYGDDVMKPVEELFHLKEDPSEMRNLATIEDSSEILAQMRTLYDQQLGHWKNEGVKTNLYSQYPAVLDRNTPWNEKELKRRPHPSEKAKKFSKKK